MRLLFIWRLNITSIFHEDLSTLIYIHLSVVFPSRMPAGPHFVAQPILLSENIPNIWRINHQQNTRRSDQIETIKTIMQTSYRITWKVLPMAQVAIFKNIRSSAKRFRLWIVLFWTKTSQRLPLYLLSITDIHIVLENDNTVLIKDLKGCKC